MKNTKSIIAMLALVSLIIIVLTFVVSADPFYYKVCLKNGQSVPITNTSSYTCVLRSGSGFCQVCTNSSFWYASWPKCSGISTCTPLGGQPVINLTLNVTSPVNGSVFSKGNIDLRVSTNKVARINLVDQLGKNTKLLCANCKSYFQTLLFPEGHNKITVIAQSDGQEKTEIREFFIDSKKPRIIKTLPNQNTFVASTFSVNYDEDNVKSVTLYVNGNSKTKNFTGSCPSGKNKNCDIVANLSEFDGKEVSYWFSIIDIVGNKIDSKAVKIKVDETFPVINSLNYTKKLKTATLIINVTEINLNKIEYADMNGDGKFKTLCSTLTKGLCTKPVSFMNYGEHNLQIKVSDKAGHAIVRDMSVVI